MAENLFQGETKYVNSIKKYNESPGTYCKRLRLNYHRNHSCDCILEPHQCIERRWHIGTDLVDMRCLCSPPRLFRFDSRGIRHISYQLARTDQPVCRCY